MWLGSGASFVNVPNLVMSTSLGMSIGKNRYNLLNTTAGEARRLGDSPNLNLDEIKNPNAELGSLGLDGNGSIVLEGGLITVDRNLLIDASRGNVKSIAGTSTTLQSGVAIRIAGQKISMNNITVSSGTQGEMGTIDVRLNSDGSTGEQGSVEMNGASLKAHNIGVSGGVIGVKNSRFEAPLGSIELLANNRSGEESRLSLSNSVLDVSNHRAPKAENQADSNPTAGSRLSSGAFNQVPHIVVASKGDITINQGLLDASSSVEDITSKDLSPNTRATQPATDRSGYIYMQARNGIALESSRILADSSSNLAGQIRLLVDGEDATGGIRVNKSRVSTSYGMGDGKVALTSSAGIGIRDSELLALSNHFPIVDGQSYAELDFEGVTQSRPLAFKGGEIILTNRSSQKGISIDRSRLLALQSTGGGGLRSDLLELRKNEVGYPVGYFGDTDAFTWGYDGDRSGGRIRITSSAGISISNLSLLDVSSRDKSSQKVENIAGAISLVNSKNGEIKISSADLLGRSGSALDKFNREHKAGFVTANNNGTIRISDSKIDVSNATSADVMPSDDGIEIPSIGIFSLSQLDFSGTTNLDASYERILDGQPVVDGFLDLYPITVRPSDDRLITKPNFTIASPVPTNEDFSTSLQLLDDLFQSQFLEELSPKRQLEPARLIESSPSASPIFVNQLQLSLPSVAYVQEPIAVELGGGDPGRTFLEWQKRTLQSTAQGLGLPSGSGKLRSIPDLQAALTQAAKASPPELSPTIRPYSPAILHLQRDDQPSGLTRITAILLIAQGEPISRSIDLPRADLDAWIRRFQRQLSRRQPSGASPAGDPSARKLSQILIDPLLPTLRQQGITALLMEVDRGLQAIPYGALPVDGRLLGDTFAITITPSLGLIDLDPSLQADRGTDGQMLLAGATDFSNGLEPLPMVRQELQALAAEHRSTLLLNDGFTASALKQRALATDVHRLHIATHASFLPGQSTAGLLYTPTAALSLADLGRSLRSRSSTSPLELISLSGCVTALGDEKSELGFVGMALQAGARSGLGTLWEVDDAATAAFFIQFYRYLQLGLAKDLAFQATQRAFLNGDVQLQGDRLVGPAQLAGPSKTVLLSGLSRQEHTLFSQGLSHPYYWAGMVLTGSPW